VEIGAEAEQFPEKEYINGIAVAVCPLRSLVNTIFIPYHTPLNPQDLNPRPDIDGQMGTTNHFKYQSGFPNKFSDWMQ
jgi:hypothetical protein